MPAGFWEKSSLGGEKLPPARGSIQIFTSRDPAGGSLCALTFVSVDLREKSSPPAPSALLPAVGTQSTSVPSSRSFSAGQVPRR